MALAREPDELDVASEQAKGDPELFRLGDRAAPILLGVQDQHRRGDVADRGDRRLTKVFARIGYLARKRTCIVTVLAGGIESK